MIMSEDPSTYNKPGLDPASMIEPTPTGTLSFPLPEYESEFQRASNAGSLSAVLWDLDQAMRAHLKYDGKASADELAQQVRDMIAEVYHLLY